MAEMGELTKEMDGNMRYAIHVDGLIILVYQTNQYLHGK
jgi:hypothetical protein